MSEVKEKKAKAPKLVYEKGMTLTKADKLRINQEFITAYFEDNPPTDKEWNEWIEAIEKIYATDEAETKKFSLAREEFCSRFMEDLAKIEEEKLSFVERMKRARK